MTRSSQLWRHRGEPGRGVIVVSHALVAEAPSCLLAVVQNMAVGQGVHSNMDIENCASLFAPARAHLEAPLTTGKRAHLPAVKP